jgi:hypothetical protein
MMTVLGKSRDRLDKKFGFVLRLRPHQSIRHLACHAVRNFERSAGRLLDFATQFVAHLFAGLLCNYLNDVALPGLRRGGHTFICKSQPLRFRRFRFGLLKCLRLFVLLSGSLHKLPSAAR